MITEVIVVTTMDDGGVVSYDICDQDGTYLQDSPTFEQAVTDAYNIAAMHSVKYVKIQVEWEEN